MTTVLRLTRCAAVCAGVISRHLQNLPQCSDCSLTCRHFQFRSIFFLGLDVTQVGWGAAEPAEVRKVCLPSDRLPHLCPMGCGQVCTGRSPRHRQWVWKTIINAASRRFHTHRLFGLRRGPRPVRSDFQWPVCRVLSKGTSQITALVPGCVWSAQGVWTPVKPYTRKWNAGVVQTCFSA